MEEALSASVPEERDRSREPEEPACEVPEPECPLVGAPAVVPGSRPLFVVVEGGALLPTSNTKRSTAATEINAANAARKK